MRKLFLGFVGVFTLLAAAATGPRLADVQKRADVLIATHQQLEAVHLLAATLQSNPDWQPGLWRLGALLYEDRRYATARRTLERLVRLDPKSGAPLALLGMCELHLRDYALARQHLQEGLALGIPPELELTRPAIYFQGLALLALGSFENAITLFSGLAIDYTVSDDDWVLASGLATLRFALLPEQASRLAPPQLEVVRQIGSLQVKLWRHELTDAKQAWQAIVESNPKVPGLHEAFGKVLLKSGDVAGAESELRAEVALNVQNAHALLALAYVFADTGRAREALTETRRSLELDPDSASAYYLMGTILFNTGQYAEAQAALDTSRDLDPDISRVHFMLSRVYAKLNRNADASKERALYTRFKQAEGSFREHGRIPASLSSTAQR